MKTYGISLNVKVSDAHSARSVLAHLEELIKDGGELALVAARAERIIEKKEKKH